MLLYKVHNLNSDYRLYEFDVFSYMIMYIYVTVLCDGKAIPGHLQLNLASYIY